MSRCSGTVAGECQTDQVPTTTTTAIHADTSPISHRRRVRVGGGVPSCSPVTAAMVTRPGVEAAFSGYGGTGQVVTRLVGGPSRGGADEWVRAGSGWPGRAASASFRADARIAGRRP